MHLKRNSCGKQEKDGSKCTVQTQLCGLPVYVCVKGFWTNSLPQIGMRSRAVNTEEYTVNINLLYFCLTTTEAFDLSLADIYCLLNIIPPQPFPLLIFPSVFSILWHPSKAALPTD